RARPRRPGEEPPRAVQASLEAVVALMALRRRDLRAQRGVVRQSRFRRRVGAFLSSSLRARARGSSRRRNRAQARRAAADRRSGRRAARCRRRRDARSACREAGALLQGPLRAARPSWRRPQPAAGSAEGIRRRRALAAMKLSIIVSAFNEEKLLGETLA